MPIRPDSVASPGGDSWPDCSSVSRKRMVGLVQRGVIPGQAPEEGQEAFRVPGDIGALSQGTQDRAGAGEQP